MSNWFIQCHYPDGSVSVLSEDDGETVVTHSAAEAEAVINEVKALGWPAAHGVWFSISEKD